MTHTLWLPWPPSVNAYYRRAGNRIHMSKKGKDFKQAVKAFLMSKGLHNEASTDRLSLIVELYAPNRRKFDIDNRVKPILDALQDGGLFVDDAQVDEIKLRRGGIDADKRGYALVSLHSI